MIHLRLPDELRETIQKAAVKRGMTMNAYCTLVLRAHLKIMQDIEKTIGGK